jgi:hypothetical protein
VAVHVRWRFRTKQTTVSTPPSGCGLAQ